MTINGILLESSVSRFTGGGEWEFVFPSPAATVWSVALFQTESKFQNVFYLKSLLTFLYLANLDRVIKYFIIFELFGYCLSGTRGITILVCLKAIRLTIIFVVALKRMGRIPLFHFKVQSGLYSAVQQSEGH